MELEKLKEIIADVLTCRSEGYYRGHNICR